MPSYGHPSLIYACLTNAKELKHVPSILSVVLYKNHRRGLPLVLPPL